MAELHDIPAATARNPAQPPRKWAQLALQAIARAPLTDLSAALDCDDSTACRLRSGEQRGTLQQFFAVLTAAGLKAVPASAICVNREKFDAIATIAQAAMADPATSRKLIWEDE